MSYVFINIFISHLDQQKVNGSVLVPTYLHEENNCVGNNVSIVDDYVLTQCQIDSSKAVGGMSNYGFEGVL